jgi:RNase H-fold protein (predicted Holliday junction resolvase)
MTQKRKYQIPSGEFRIIYLEKLSPLVIRKINHQLIALLCIVSKEERKYIVCALPILRSSKLKSSNSFIICHMSKSMSIQFVLWDSRL